MTIVTDLSVSISVLTWQITQSVCSSCWKHPADSRPASTRPTWLIDWHGNKPWKPHSPCVCKRWVPNTRQHEAEHEAEVRSIEPKPFKDEWKQSALLSSRRLTLSSAPSNDVESRPIHAYLLLIPLLASIRVITSLRLTEKSMDRTWANKKTWSCVKSSTLRKEEVPTEQDSLCPGLHWAKDWREQSSLRGARTYGAGRFTYTATLLTLTG